MLGDRKGPGKRILLPNPDLYWQVGFWELNLKSRVTGKPEVEAKRLSRFEAS